MDPFSRLPWFILKDILSQLPDLETLHQAHNASPAIFEFLHQNGGLFSEIMETIIHQYLPPESKYIFKYTVADFSAIVFIWWLTKEDHPDNPFSRNHSFQSVLSWLLETTDECGNYTGPSLPRTVPTSILCRLLACSFRMRQVGHAFFHDLVDHCLALQPYCVLDPKDIWRMRSANSWYMKLEGFRHELPPQVRQEPVDIGPTTIYEERKIRLLMLHVLIFYELQRAAVDFNKFEASVSERESLRQMTPKEYYRQRGRNVDWNGENLTMLESWMTAKAAQGQEPPLSPAAWLRLPVVDDAISKRVLCCPQATPLAAADFHVNRDGLSGTSDLWRIAMSVQTPMEFMPRTIPASLGAFLFGGERLCSLKLLPSESRERRQLARGVPALVIIILSVLTPEQYEEIVVAQRENVSVIARREYRGPSS